MKKILKSLFVLSVAVLLMVGATRAFFSDTETSTGNRLVAGAIDLMIDNTSYYNGEYSEGTSWLTPSDLDESHLFFNFLDLKPGDYGEDTISIHVHDNDSWLCADVTLTENADNDQTEPEADVDENGPESGELAESVYFMWWADDGDNVLENDEVLLPAGPLGVLEVGETATVALADSQTNIWGDLGALPGGSMRYVGKAWCYGSIIPEPLKQDGKGAESERTPATSTGGFTCDGSQVGNEGQTDSLMADISFRAVQSRHNEEFVCSPEFIKIYDDGYNDSNRETLYRDDYYLPHVDYNIAGGCIEFEFINPTPFQFVFDYRVDGELGDDWSLTDDLIDAGPLATQTWGQHYNWVTLSGGESQTVNVCGQEKIEAGLRVGAERDWYFDWIVFETQ